MSERRMTRLDKWTVTCRSLADGLEALIAAIESALLAVLGRVGTWAAPIPSALIVAHAAGQVLPIGLAGAWAVAVAVEIIGLAAGSLWLKEREWNLTKGAKEARADEGRAFALLLSYVIVSEIIVAAFQFIETWRTGSFAGWVSVLLPALSFVAVLISNERVMQANRQSNRALAKAAHDGASVSASGTPVAQSGTPIERGTYGAFVAALAQRNGAGPLGVDEVMEQFGIPKRTAYRWIEKAKNGHGVEVVG